MSEAARGLTDQLTSNDEEKVKRGAMYYKSEEEAGYMILSRSDVPHGVRPLRDGYCAPYRPSLTDTKIRSRSRSWIDQYELVPRTRPKLRPWLSRVPTDLHLEHQVWNKEQGWLWLGSPEKNKFAPRLGVGITVDDVKSIEPASLCWRGNVSLSLKVSLKETLGISEVEARDSAKVLAAWPCEGARGCCDRDTAEEFLKKAFGAQCYNIITDHAHSQATIRGSRSFSEFEIEDGQLIGRWDFDGLFYCPVDLHNFPFDVCCWDVLFSFIGWSPGVTYSHSALQNLSEFSLYGLQGLNRASNDIWNPYTCEQNVVPNRARYEESFVYCRFHSRRSYASVLFNIITPTAIVVLLSSIGLVHASGGTPNSIVNAGMDSLGFMTTALLTVVAMKFTSSDSLPKEVGAATILDRYILTCIVILSLSIALVACCSEESLVEFHVVPIYFGVLLLVHILLVVLVINVYHIPSAKRGEQLYAVPHQEDVLDMHDLKHFATQYTAGFAKKADMNVAWPCEV